MPPSAFSAFKNIRASTQQNYVVIQAKVEMQHSLALNVNIKSVQPELHTCFQLSCLVCQTQVRPVAFHGVQHLSPVLNGTCDRRLTFQQNMEILGVHFGRI